MLAPKTKVKPCSVDAFLNMINMATFWRVNVASLPTSWFAGGWRGAFESWTGDWKERSLSHCFQKRNYQSTLVCDQCGAVSPHARTPHRMLEYVYSNFQDDAPWKQTLRNHEDYLRETPDCMLTPWLSVPGFNISRIRWDVAHTILLGAGKDIAASFLCDLVSWANYLWTWYIFVNFPMKYNPPNELSGLDVVPRWKTVLTLQVELPILQRLVTLGVTALDVLGGVDKFFPRDGNLQTYGNKIMNLLGRSFRLWCRRKRIEKPPATWDLHVINRGANDSKNAYPVLDSNVKACHTKPILFFLSELGTAIASHCTCILIFDSWLLFVLLQNIVLVVGTTSPFRPVNVCVFLGYNILFIFQDGIVLLILKTLWVLDIQNPR